MEMIVLIKGEKIMADKETKNKKVEPAYISNAKKDINIIIDKIWRRKNAN